MNGSSLAAPVWLTTKHLAVRQGHRQRLGTPEHHQRSVRPGARVWSRTASCSRRARSTSLRPPSTIAEPSDIATVAGSLRGLFRLGTSAQVSAGRVVALGRLAARLGRTGETGLVVADGKHRPIAEDDRIEARPRADHRGGRPAMPRRRSAMERPMGVAASPVGVGGGRRRGCRASIGIVAARREQSRRLPRIATTFEFDVDITGESTPQRARRDVNP